MAININGQVLRNVPEQVSKNVEDIEDLQDRVTDLENGIIGGDLNVGGNLSVTGSTSGTTASYSGAIGADSGSITGNLSVGGNATVAGSLSAASASLTGNISASNYNKVQNVLKGTQNEAGFYDTDGDITLTAEVNGFSFPYAHYRVSNGKLNIVILMTSDGSTTPSMNDWIISPNTALVPLPGWVLNKLIPFAGIDLVTKVENGLPPSSSENGVLDRNAYMLIQKTTNGVYLLVRWKALTALASLLYSWRWEFNFVL